MAPYRVLVVDDSAFMRKIISDLIQRDEQYIIAATAVNGAEAVAAVLQHRPDVITMDLEMPVMNGIQSLQQIMKQAPTPVIMLSGISEDNTHDTIKALQFGAFDFIRKPSSAVSADQFGELLLEKLRIAVLARRRGRVEPSDNNPKQEAAPDTGREATAIPPDRPDPIAGSADRSVEERLHKSVLDPARNKRYIVDAKRTAADKLNEKKQGDRKPGKSIERFEKPVPRSVKLPPPASPEQAKKQPLMPLPSIGGATERQGKPPRTKGTKLRVFQHVVAIGTSTGGPRALHEVICSLPKAFPAPVLVVQHMPPKFTKSLAQRLDSFSELEVLEAENNMQVSAGVVYIAPGGKHMEMAKDASGYTIRLTDHPHRNGHRPSVDILFESLISCSELARHAVIMTGMGSDGAKGMKLLVESGAVSTIAESEDTCIVYGMPRSAVEAGCVQTVLPLQQIASRLVKAVSK